ncbi:MAG TPA: hypothetical protein VFA92_04830 [Candidatus Binatia bacterium]|nr:hypothetical protein [Candidatus Binatia bacterium]
MEAFVVAFGYGLTGLVLVGGLVLSIVLWGRAPRAAGLAIGASVLALVGLIATVTWLAAAPRLIESRGLSASSVAPFQFGLNVVATLLSAAANALLLGAIFTGRGRPATRGPR